jgi:glycine/D-amino acid oxidase-like deaminating enzyme
LSDERLPGSADVVVIGAGIAGSAAAYALAKKGLSVALLDKGRVAASRAAATGAGAASSTATCANCRWP